MENLIESNSNNKDHIIFNNKNEILLNNYIECTVLYKRVFGKKLAYVHTLPLKKYNLSEKLELKLSNHELIKSIKIGDIIKVQYINTKLIETNEVEIITKCANNDKFLVTRIEINNNINT